MAKISAGQRNVLDQIKPGVRLALDPRTGRFSLFSGDQVTTVDQRPVDTMLRNGILERDAVGQCRIAADVDIQSNTVVRKTHLLDADGDPVICRYTSHNRSLAKRAMPDSFAKLPPAEQCPACVKLGESVPA